MYIADLHIHSHYSYATSKTCTLEYVDLWARRKGIHIVGTGDFTHPAWRDELREKLIPAEDGLYILKEEYRIRDEVEGKKVGAYGHGQKEMIPRFVVSGEISSVYKKEGRSRKVHSLVLLPDLEAAEQIAKRLSQIGNICSDGRPTLRLDCRDLIELALDECEESIYIPAHIWTPHFSVFGAFSGFRTPKECFGDMTPYVYAMETGLSSDPLMNRRVSVLDDYRLVSNSDAHSPGNLGREATLFDVELSYGGIKEAVQTGKGLCGTIEFFPQEGKYHLDGHRKCGVCFTPAETEAHGGVCPVCGRAVTVGVAHRIEELADRSEEEAASLLEKEMFESLIPLKEVIAIANGFAVKGKRTEREYMRLLVQLGSEFEVLRKIPPEEISRAAGEQTGRLVDKLRRGQVKWNSGFDGEYGTIDPGVIQ